MVRRVLVAALLLSCRREAEPTVDPPHPPSQPPCAAPGDLIAIDQAGSSSALALARHRGRRIAFVADEDDERLHAIDLDARALVQSVALAGRPGHVLIAHGRVHLSMPELDLVVELSPELTECRRISTPAEPVALAQHGKAILVANRRGRALTRIERDRTHSIALSRDPSAILVAGNNAVVAHRVGSIVSIVALDRSVAREVSFAWRDRVGFAGLPVGDMPRFAVQAHALGRLGDRIAMPMVLAYPGDSRVEVTFQTGYGAPSVRGVDGYFPHEAAVATFTVDGGAPRIAVGHDTVPEGGQRISFGRVTPPRPPCLLPRSVGVVGQDAVVACAGIDQLVVYSREGRERTRVALASGPLAVATDAGDAIVWSPFARVLSVVDVASARVTTTIAVPADRARDVAWVEGRRLFHAPLGFDGRACASCHPDGLDDGLVWSTPHGPLQAPVLAGRLDTAPFGWHGRAPTLQAHLQETLVRMGAKPMSASEMDPLVTYLRAMRAQPTRTLDPLARRGRTLFASAEVGCATCHQDGGTDGLRHDVGTGGTFDTPSLAGVAYSGPYLHDGRFATLREVITATARTMGSTDQLSDDDLAALIAYLKTL